jgi:hypothetical protein
MNVYLDLETPGGSGFWVKGNRWVTEGTKRVSLRATGSRGGRILTQQGGFQVSRQGEQGEQGKQGEQGEQGEHKGNKGNKGRIMYIS